MPINLGDDDAELRSELIRMQDLSLRWRRLENLSHHDQNETSTVQEDTKVAHHIGVEDQYLHSNQLAENGYPLPPNEDDKEKEGDFNEYNDNNNDDN